MEKKSYRGKEEEEMLACAVMDREASILLLHPVSANVGEQARTSAAPGRSRCGSNLHPPYKLLYDERNLLFDKRKQPQNQPTTSPRAPPGRTYLGLQQSERDGQLNRHHNEHNENRQLRTEAFYT
jgi:hypothetical protein